jgi:hypothetical protein
MTILDTEVLHWYSADAPPDDDSFVIVCVPGSDEPIWLGYYGEAEDRWHACDGTWYKRGAVKAWSPLPTGATGADETGE